MREVASSTFTRGRTFVFDDMGVQACVSDEPLPDGTTYQHLSISGRLNKPSIGQIEAVGVALLEAGVLNREGRQEVAGIINPFVRHFVPDAVARRHRHR